MMRKCYDYNIREYRITEDSIIVFNVKRHHTRATLAHTLIRICHEVEYICNIHPVSIILFGKFLM